MMVWISKRGITTLTLYFGLCLDISPFIFMLLETYNFSTLCIACSSSSSVATPKIYINNSQNVAWLFFSKSQRNDKASSIRSLGSVFCKRKKEKGRKVFFQLFKLV